MTRNLCCVSNPNHVWLLNPESVASGDEKLNVEFHLLWGKRERWLP